MAPVKSSSPESNIGAKTALTGGVRYFRDAPEADVHAASSAKPALAGARICGVGELPHHLRCRLVSGIKLAALAGPPLRPMADAAGSTPRSSGVSSRSSTWPLAISTTSLAAWLKSRGRFGCLSAMIGIIGAIANKARPIWAATFKMTRTENRLILADVTIPDNIARSVRRGQDQWRPHDLCCDRQMDPRAAEQVSTELRIGARWRPIAAPIYPPCVGPEGWGRDG